MDACEAMKVVMSRIKDLDPENASKILGHILLQGQGEKEVIRLAFAPESLLLSCIHQAKTFLGIPQTSPSPETSIVAKASKIMMNMLHLNNPSSPAPTLSRTGSRPISYAGVLTGSSDDEFLGGGVVDPLQLQVYSPVDSSLSGRNESLIFPYPDDLSTVPSPQFPRTNSVKDVVFPPNLELGCRPCMYFSRGGCKNGDSCRFSHNDIGLDIVNSSGFDELLRFKALHQQHRLSPPGLHHFPFKPTDIRDENQRSDFLSTGMPSTGASSSSRQIYLTFPADTTFKEEDVATYFGNFGPVQDVRIPYQQRRMFGFVTFLYPETVKTYWLKETLISFVIAVFLSNNTKIKEETNVSANGEGDFASGVTSSGSDSIDQLDIPFGPRRLLNAKEKILSRKIEEHSELRNAIELQGQRMMNIQLADWHYQSYDSNLL